jgi:cell division cycle protein 20 (cofactor of APC complex)
VLDLPEIGDDFYSNPLDWGSKLLAVALDRDVYVQSEVATRRLCRCMERVTAVSWARDGSRLAVGTEYGATRLCDAETRKEWSVYSGDVGIRVGSVGWSATMLGIGLSDGTIVLRDDRQRAPVGSLAYHSESVCGLAWNRDNVQLGSGCNDDCLAIWDVRSPNKPRFGTKAHDGAVKAIAWKDRDLLATGGGSADCRIKFWKSDRCVGTIEAGAQVTSLLWHGDLVVSGHGFGRGAENRVSVWEYPSTEKVTDLLGHRGRVLALAQNGDTVASASADETLRMWKL